MIIRRSGKKRFYRAAAVTAFILAVLAVLIFFAFDDRLGVTKFTVKSQKIPEGFNGFKIVMLTDLHCARFGENQTGLLELVDSLSPDIVVFTGDMIDEKLLDYTPIEELCAGLTDKYRVYSVWGNHDRWISYSDFNMLVKLYRDYGVTTLCGDTVYVEHGGETIALSGADDPASWNDGALDFVAQNGIGVSPAEGYYNILLYHRANIFPVLSELGFDLVLSGHLHGGQIRVPFLGGLISPTMEWFPDYTAGKYEKNGTLMIVGRGLGNAVRVPRVFNPPEIVLLTLKSA